MARGLALSAHYYYLYSLPYNNNTTLSSLAYLEPPFLALTPRLGFFFLLAYVSRWLNYWPQKFPWITENKIFTAFPFFVMAREIFVFIYVHPHLPPFLSLSFGGTHFPCPLIPLLTCPRWFPSPLTGVIIWTRLDENHCNEWLMRDPIKVTERGGIHVSERGRGDGDGDGCIGGRDRSRAKWKNRKMMTNYFT